MPTSDLRDQLQSALGAHYAIERELGRGGMATVYLAEDAKHHRSVALKVLHADLATSLGPERFRREIAFAAKLQHPHILTVLDSGETATGLLWFTMPYIEGESLRDRLRRQHQLPLDDALRIAREIALALDYAHRHGVIHRDIKPENILLVDGQAMIADFGIARALGSGALPSGATLTETGMAIGTPAYMSPEQAAGERSLEGTTDVYSLGAVLYEMLTGEPPFTGPTAQAIAAKMMAGDPPAVRRTRPTVPIAVEAAVRKALAPVPADRYASTAEFARVLDAATGLVTAVAPGRVDGRFSIGSRKLQSAIVIGLFAVLAAGALVVAARRAERGTAFVAKTDSGATPRLVVLPFENLGRPEDEYFADGMTEELTARLARLHGLTVISRLSALQYKKTDKGIPQIGQELGVAYILEGTVRWDKPAHGPSRVRVTPELIRVAGDGHVWAQVYDAVLADVFAVQSSIATQVAESLDVALLAPERTVLAAKPTVNLAAYDYYLRGKAYDVNVYAASDAMLAVQMYQRAVELDSTFALAYAALARARLLRSWLYGQTGELPLARASADRAQQLGPELAETHMALGYYYYMGGRDYERALAEFESVRAQQPNDADVVYAIGLIHRRQGRWTETISDLARACQLDPRNHICLADLGFTYEFLRRYSDADRALGAAIAVSPLSLYQQYRAGLYLEWDGNATRARALLREAPGVLTGSGSLHRAWAPVLMRLFAGEHRATLARFSLGDADGDTVGYHLIKAEFYRATGDSASARASFDSARIVLEALLVSRPVNVAAEYIPLETSLALAHAGLGDKTTALRFARAAADRLPVSQDPVNGAVVQMALLEVYMETGEYDAALDQIDYLLSIPALVSIPLLRVDPLYVPLRGNPRFERLIAQPSTHASSSGAIRPAQ